MKSVLKKIYSLIPFKKQLFQFIRFFGAPPHSIYKHLHFTGVIKIKADTNASFKMMHYGMEIENDIFWKGLTGGWEKISINIWKELCKQSRLILDVGANTGIYALTAKAVNPTAQVIAFEPLRQMCRKLKANAELNKYEITCVEKALSDKDGTAIIYETGGDHEAAATLNEEVKATGKLGKETIIETITLDSFFKQNRLPKADLIKIDVETYEPYVMAGYKDHLADHHPDFLIEVLTEEVGNRLQTFFNGLNYYYFNIDDKNGTVRRVDKIVKSDYFNYLICSPESAGRLGLV